MKNKKISIITLIVMFFMNFSGINVQAFDYETEHSVEILESNEIYDINKSEVIDITNDNSDEDIKNNNTDVINDSVNQNQQFIPEVEDEDDTTDIIINENENIETEIEDMEKEEENDEENDEETVHTSSEGTKKPELETTIDNNDGNFQENEVIEAEENELSTQNDSVLIKEEDGINTYEATRYISPRGVAIGNVDIISKPSSNITVKQAEDWAKSRGATAEFVSLAALYNKYAAQRGGINWVLAYVQAAKETGYGKFGGVITAEYHNPCGLKTPQGGNDNDPNAHKKFDNWDQGVMAHLDHLALYAGAANYPKTVYVEKYKKSGLASNETYDPRHIGNWYYTKVYGKATNIIDLGGNWAPSLTYGVEIFRLYCSLTGDTVLSPVSNLDNPTSNLSVTDGKLRVRGWALNAYGVKQVKVYVDGKYIGDAAYGVSRTDVAKVYPNYYNSANSGFDTTFNISNLSNGTKKLKVEIICNDGTVSQTIERNFVNSYYVPRSNLETPNVNDTITTQSLYVKGWALHEKGVKAVEVYIDGQKYSNAVFGKVRNDVNNTFPGYVNGANSGFEGSIDISALSNGSKKLTIKIIANDNSYTTIDRAITINKTQLIARGWVDTPTNNQSFTNGTLNIKGWALHPKGIKSINAYIDGKSYGSIPYGAIRSDVDKAYPGYSTGSKCGFEGNVNISNLTPGTKNLTIDIVANDGTKQTISRIFVVKDLGNKSNLETPTVNYNVTSQSLSIKGWALSLSGTNKVEVYIDNKYMGSIASGIARNDVNNVYPGYYKGNQSGFSGNIDISEIANGKRKLTVKIIANNATYQTIDRYININKVQLIPRSNLESINDNMNVLNGKLIVKGWALHSAGIKSVSVTIDGKSYGNIKYGLTRDDVNRVYPGYNNGNKSGFEGQIDISSLSEGKKTVKVIITANNGTNETHTRTINKSSLYPRSNLESISNNQTITNGNITIKGWAVNKAGVKSVTVNVDGKSYGTIPYGKTRTDVNSVYPGYPSGNNAGFEGKINISSLKNGTKKISVIITGNDGSKQTITTNINLQQLASINCLDNPTANYMVTDQKLYVKGWALSAAGTKEVRVKVDGTLLGKATIGVSRPDVYNVYPKYNNKNAGYNGTFSLSSMSKGKKTLLIEIEDKNGNVQTVTRTFYNGTGKTVYIDPGHDYGGDQGAFATHGSITYSETEINIDIAEKLRTELINMGYNVVMARRKGERPTSPDYRTNLWNRINAANDMKADFYVSIHNNMSGSSSTTGTEVYYSSDNPNKLSASALNSKVTASKSAATKVSQGVASALGTNNRGAKDDSFMVVRYTNMPAILVECGFMSNAAEVKKLTTASYQTKIAKAIADGIKATIN